MDKSKWQQKDYGQVRKSQGYRIDY